MSIHDQPLDGTDCFDEADAFTDTVVGTIFSESEDIFEDPKADVYALFQGENFTSEIRRHYDTLYACSCATQHKDQHALFSGHETSCDVRAFDLWEHALCEWSHMLKRFLYYPVPTDEEVIELARKDQFGATKKPAQNTSLFGKGAWDEGAYSGYSAMNYVPKCRHSHQKVEFPDGTLIHASSSDQTKDRVKPDFGFYAFDSFRPKPGITCLIDWVDFGLPKAPMQLVVYELKRAVALVQAGYDVEVGCMGGHGRTGTMLGCLATLCGVAPGEAVAWVRKHYCKEAIETDEQEWFVEAFDAYVRGVEAPEKPKPKPKPPPPTRDGWCPECKKPITTKGCDGYGCAHKDCRLYNISSNLPPVLTSDPKGGDQ